MKRKFTLVVISLRLIALITQPVQASEVFLKDDVPKYCQENLTEHFEEMIKNDFMNDALWKLPASHLINKNYPAFLSSLDALPTAERYFASWLLLTYPDEQGAHLVNEDRFAHLTTDYWNTASQRLAPHLGSAPEFSLERELKIAQSRSIIHYTKEMNAFTDTVFKVPPHEDWTEQLKELDSESKKICKITRLPKCKLAFQYLIELFRPIILEYGQYSNIPRVIEMLKDPSYIGGAAYAAEMALKRAEFIEPSELKPGTVFDDLVEGYRRQGLNEKTAINHAFEIMGFYASRGASTSAYWMIFHHGNRHLGLALQVLSSVIQRIDLKIINTAQNHLQRHLYSYPGVMKTKCYFPKPYHFWMPAYYAHILREKKIPKITAYTVPFLLSVGYQFNSKTDGRDPKKVFFNPLYDSYNNMIRNDLALAQAGVSFGSNPYSRYTIALDAGVRRIINHAQPFIKISDEKMNLLIQQPEIRRSLWNRRFQPFSNFVPFYRIFRDSENGSENENATEEILKNLSDLF